jgi:hypothetical protein
MPDKPAWRSLFDGAERLVGRPLEAWVASATFADLLATVTQVQRYSQRRFERAAERGLRMFNLPAASDLDRLARQVGAVERHLRELSHQIDQDGADARRRAPASPAQGRGDTHG